MARKLEEKAESFLGCKPATVVSASSATAGITASAMALQAEKWAAPSWTFTATVAGILSAGKEPFLGEIRESDHIILDRNLPQDVDGLVVVAPFGKGIEDLGGFRQSKLIVDAAASMPSFRGKLKTLRPNSVVVFSLHATKCLGIGEGGLIACSSSELAEEIRSILNFGFMKSRESRVPGFNGKLSETLASIGNAAFDNWEVEQSEWLNARKYARDVAESLDLMSFDPGGDWASPYWIIEAESRGNRHRIEEALRENGVETRRWWGDGCHRMAAYRSLPRSSLKVTEKVADRNLGLPFFRGMTKSDFLRIQSIVGDL